MPISRLVDARKWIKGFENDTLESNCLAPGTTIKPHDRFKDRELTSWMCGIEAAKILTLLYGPPNGKVSGKVKKASFLCLEFEGHIITAISEKNYGTSWHLFTGSPGSRYGRAMYTSCDLEVVNFIPRFFAEIAEAYMSVSVLKSEDFQP